MIDAAGDAQHRQRDAEEFEYVRADVDRQIQDHEAVDRDPTRDVGAHDDTEAGGRGQEDERAADRVDDREQRGKREQEEVHLLRPNCGAQL